MGAKIHDMGPGENGGRVYAFHCPGCGYSHLFEVPRWNWNGSVTKPTFKPSLLCNKDFPEFRCHLWVLAGKIIFLNDCWHELKGQTIDMFDWE